MDPVISKTFDEMLKKEEMDARSAERWGRLEKRIDDAEALLQEHEHAVDTRLTSLENYASS
jgi:enoyl-CoA hydratase/carnithine racemase